MPAATSKPGDKYGRLELIEPTDKRFGGSVIWKCRCSCKNKTIKYLAIKVLKSGNTSSCGCKKLEMVAALGRRNKTHGAAVLQNPQGTGRGHALYKVWESIKNRCNNKKDKRYKRYGGKNISIYSEWIDYQKFENYVLRLKNCPPIVELTKVGVGKHLKLSLDRIDNDGNYEPGNLRWATPKQQARKRVDTFWVKIKERKEKVSLAEACEIRGLPYKQVWNNIRKRGWTVKEALNKG